MKALIITISTFALLGISSPAIASPGDGSVTRDHRVAKARSAPTSFKTKPKVGTKARCPVMKGEFTIKSSSKWTYYKGRYYFFCCPGCKPKFDANPSKYAGH